MVGRVPDGAGDPFATGFVSGLGISLVCAFLGSSFFGIGSLLSELGPGCEIIFESDAGLGMALESSGVIFSPVGGKLCEGLVESVLKEGAVFP